MSPKAAGHIVCIHPSYPPPHDRKPLSWHWKCWEPFLCQNNSFRACFSEDLLTNVLKTRILQHNEAPPLLSLTQKCAQNSFLLQNASFEQWSVLSPEATLWCYSSFHLWAPAPNVVFYVILCYLCFLLCHISCFGLVLLFCKPSFLYSFVTEFFVVLFFGLTFLDIPSGSLNLLHKYKHWRFEMLRRCIRVIRMSCLTRLSLSRYALEFF